MGTTAEADAATVAEKTEEELRKEIDELQRQQREINERLYPRGARRGGFSGAGPRNFAANGARKRGLGRPADRNEAEDQPPAKRRLSSTVVKLEEGEIEEDADGMKEAKEKEAKEKEAKEKEAKEKEAKEKEAPTVQSGDRKQSESHKSDLSKRDGDHRASRRDSDIPPDKHIPRVLPKNEDPNLLDRNKRMLGRLLGTLEKFRKEDKQLSGTDAYMRRSISLQRAEQRAREESERLRQQERERVAERRRRDLTLRARVNAKTDEKRLELLFLKWSEHHKRLCNFIRTKTEPSIYYLPNKPLEEDPIAVEQKKEQAFLEWKTARREELTTYQKQTGDEYLVNVEKELERWQNARKSRKANDDMNLQETMDKELDTHRLEHGPKKRKIPGGSNNEEDDDVEDIDAGEDDIIDDVLDVGENVRKGDEGNKPAVNSSIAETEIVELK